ncbi:MAG: methylmalonyl Co-A mutase-associated GTPase MeaB [Acidobacteria bacterium]|nr:methylmalonyl Co-A mutase-associated GTPase MeaB [Acidobacteriota bacterium]
MRVHPSTLAEHILRADSRSIARACTLVENRAPGSVDLLKSLFPHTGRAFTLGITGAPGAGKSTLTSALVTELRRRAARVAVIAVDPSSPFTGGAVLGDRIRMLQHHADPGVFIRSMATRGALGGLAPSTHDLALVLDAAGFEWILIETVGVGQDEVDVARLAGATAVVVCPGAGDDVQAIKAGILEIASVLVINKADQPGANQLERDLSEWHVPIVRTVATTGEGIAALLEQVHKARASGPNGEAQWILRLRAMYAERILRNLDPARLAEAARLVSGRQADPYTIIEEWLNI